MGNKQDASVEMYRLLREVFSQNKTEFGKLPNFISYESQFNTDFDTLTSLRPEQFLITTDSTTVKAENRVKLETKAITLCKYLNIYATVNNLSQLKAETDYSKTDIKRMKHGELTEFVDALLIRAEEHKDKTAEYNIAEADITGLKTLNDKFKSSIPKPTINKLNSREYNNAVDECHDNIEESLGNIDLIVELISETNTALYSKYKSARKVTVRGTRSVAVKINVTDAQGNPLKGVQVTLELLNTSETPSEEFDEMSMTRTSAEKGGMLIKTIDEGSYRVTAVKTGFKRSETILHYCSGEPQSLVIKMEQV
ncbi:carboxypeptidase-like regulatory domain-containing protein [Parabacteroides sp. FAFU027]|uniref:carboxypeptidase-like regulatory domain-containing protein n=1 Tax=Parabacteroides sp. FAFU027 TaxID=2922715 RepID=UPI001FAF6F43|nr:carboxypeptidase-like regulatory domain-containing protein [Parabacteroides sp. FAFU027]